MNRLEAIEALRMGDVIGGRFVGNEKSRGRLHIFTIDICEHGDSFLAVFHSNIMFDIKTKKPIPYIIRLTHKQVVDYIHRHYPEQEITKEVA